MDGVDSFAKQRLDTKHIRLYSADKKLGVELTVRQSAHQTSFPTGAPVSTL